MSIFGGIRNGIRKLFALTGAAKLLDWLKPDLPKAQGLEVRREGSNIKLPVVYGTRLVGGIVVHKWVTDTVTGLSGIRIRDRKNTYLHYIVAFCHGEIDDIEEFYFNGERSDEVQYQDSLYINYTTGLAAGESLQSAIDNIPNFTSAMVGENVAYAHIVLFQSKDQSYWRGEPDIQAVIRGRKVYDPRTETTAYSENNAICTLDYLTSTIYGRGLTLGEIDVQTYIDAADFCDESTSSDVTTITYVPDDDPTAPPIPEQNTTTINVPRYRINAIVDTEEQVFDNYKILLQSFRAYPRRPNGRPAIGIEDIGTPIMTFDSAKGEIFGDINYQLGGLRDRYNSFTVVFPNELDRYERDEVVYPPRDSQIYQDWLDEDNGKELHGELELNTISDRSSATQTAEIAAKRSRIGGALKTTLDARARFLEPGDIIGISDESFGWTDKPFRITRIKGTVDNTFDVELREHENTVYPWSGAEWDETVGGTWLGNPYQPEAPSNLTLTPDPTLATTGTLRWDIVNDSFVREYDTVIEVDDGGEWVQVKDDTTRGTRYTVPLLDVGDYRISVRSVTTLNLQSDAAVITFTLAIPVTPTSIDTTISDWGVESRPQLAGIGLGTTFEHDIVAGNGTGHTPSVKARGASYTVADLLPNTQHTLFARTVNPYGVSAWVSETFTTTETGNQVEPFIETIERDLDVLNSELGGVDSILEQVAQDINEIYDRSDVTVRLRAEELTRKQEIQALNDDLDTLENTTLPALQDELDAAEVAIQGLDDKFPIGTTDIQDDAISTPKLLSNAVTAAKILAGAVTTDKMTANSINGDRISANTLAAGKIIALSIGADRLAANAITTDKLNALAVTAAKIATGAIETDKLDANAVTAAKIAALTITANEIATNAITTDKINALAVNADKIASNAITTAKLDALAVTAVKIAASAITADKIDVGAVTADKIEAEALYGKRSVLEGSTDPLDPESDETVVLVRDASGVELPNDMLTEWAGNSPTHPTNPIAINERTKSNGYWWVSRDGTYRSNSRRSSITNELVNLSNTTAQQEDFALNSVQGFANLNATVFDVTGTKIGAGEPAISLVIELRNDTTVLSSRTVDLEVESAGVDEWQFSYSGEISVLASEDNSSNDYNTSNLYNVRVYLSGSGITTTTASLRVSATAQEFSNN